MAPHRDKRELLVVIVEDPLLRSALVGRLTLDGETLLTLEAPQLARAFKSAAPRPAILVVETKDADQLDAVHAFYPWELSIVLGGRGDMADPGQPILAIEPEQAPVSISAALARWRQERPAAE